LHHAYLAWSICVIVILDNEEGLTQIKQE